MHNRVLLQKFLQNGKGKYAWVRQNEKKKIAVCSRELINFYPFLYFILYPCFK